MSMQGGDDHDELQTPPRGYDWFAFRTVDGSVDEQEPVTPRMTRMTRLPEVDEGPSAGPPSVTPPLGLTIPPPSSAWGRATVVVGTLLGVAALLMAYSATLAGEGPRPSLQKVLARTSLDLDDADGHAAALASISRVVRAYGPACIGHRPEKVSLVVRRSEAGRLEVMSLPNVVEPRARRCLTTTLGEMEVRPSVQADAPWSIEVDFD